MDGEGFINYGGLIAIMRQELRKKTRIADDAVIQLKISLEDLRRDRISKFLESS